jgi:hypothetical protein
MSEDERRDLIARQHRALYGSESNMYPNDPSTSRPLPQDVRVTTGNVQGAFRGSSPYDPFGMQTGGQNSAPGSAVVKPQRGGPGDDKEGSGAPGNRSRANSTSSPASNQNTSSYALYDSTSTNAQQSSRTSTSSPGGSPPRNSNKQPTSSNQGTSSGNVAPIGTRPSVQQQQSQQPPVGAGVPQPGNLQKRSTTPLTSPLSYGFATGQVQSENNVPDAAQQEDQQQQQQQQKMNNNLRGAWGNTGVWGGKGGLGVQAKVWG